ncbi:MAG: hypothetical protein PPP58_00370 [Natronomonas sp.]
MATYECEGCGSRRTGNPLRLTCPECGNRLLPPESTMNRRQ